jgi:hypothetical protein
VPKIAVLIGFIVVFLSLPVRFSQLDAYAFKLGPPGSTWLFADYDSV